MTAPKTELLNIAVQDKTRPPVWDTQCVREMADGQPPQYESSVMIEFRGRQQTFLGERAKSKVESEKSAAERALTYLRNKRAPTVPDELPKLERLSIAPDFKAFDATRSGTAFGGPFVSPNARMPGQIPSRLVAGDGDRRWASVDISPHPTNHPSLGEIGTIHTQNHEYREKQEYLRRHPSEFGVTCFHQLCADERRVCCSTIKCPHIPCAFTGDFDARDRRVYSLDPTSYDPFVCEKEINDAESKLNQLMKRIDGPLTPKYRSEITSQILTEQENILLAKGKARLYEGVMNRRGGVV